MSNTSCHDGGSIVVGVILETAHAEALDAFCGRTLSSRAGALRRFAVEALRAEGLLPAAPAVVRVASRTRAASR